MTPLRRGWYAFGAFRLDPIEKVLFHNGQPVPLTPKAFETLVALVERHGHLVTKEELFHLVWPDAFVEENNLAQNVSMLRRALGERASGLRLIETVPKRGYRFVGAVVEEFDDAQGTAAAARAVQPAGEADPGMSPPPPILGGAPIRRAGVWTLIAAVPVAAATLAAFLVRELPPDAAGAPTAVTDGAARPGAGDLTRIAVLPFVNLGSPDDEYFVAGMTEEITSRLARLSRLAVPSSTTVTGYDPHGKSLRRIGADLGVEYVVEGSVRWGEVGSGRSVRITPKLVRIADDTTVWTEQYDAPLADLFAVQTDIAYRITGSLEIAIDARERRAVEARPTADPDAYLTYLRGLAAFQQGSTDTSNQARARRELEDAVARDPKFALAWSALASVYAMQYVSGSDRRPGVRQAAHDAARTAIALDAALPQAHTALATVHLSDREYELGLRELEIAREGLPNSADLLLMIADTQQRKGQWTAAGRTYARAFELDAVRASPLVGVHYTHLRQYEAARRYIEVANAGNRADAAVPEAWVHFSERGDVAAARRVLESALTRRSPPDARVKGLLARLEWIDGRHQRALALIADMDPAGAWLPANFRFPAALAAGQVYDSLGRHHEAAAHYETAMTELQERLRHAPEDYQIHAALGMAAAGLGRAPEAVRHGTRAVELQPVTSDAAQGPVYVYVLALIHARLGDDAAAFATLDSLFSVPGFYNEVWVQRDPGFAALRRHAAFPAYVDRWSSQGQVR
jgi:DNA-binding winged helix-turn-helix (wHTH) protein/TolB-like protein/Tfp pilus assembly protein PilF